MIHINLHIYIHEHIECAYILLKETEESQRGFKWVCNGRRATESARHYDMRTTYIHMYILDK